MRLALLVRLAGALLLAAGVPLAAASCSAAPSYALAGDASFDAPTTPEADSAIDANIKEGGPSDQDGATLPDAGNLYRVFVTSSGYAGSGLGGISGADTLCQTHGATFKPRGTFRAFLSTSATGAPEDRFPRGRAYYRVGDDTKVFDSIDNGPLVPVKNTERGVSAVLVTTWVGDSEPSPKGRCGDWNGLDGGTSVTVTGNSDSVATWKASTPLIECTALAALYCFEVDP